MAGDKDGYDLSARVAEIEQRIIERSERRDREISDIGKDLAELAARVAGAESTAERLADALERNRPPSILAIISPAIAAAVLVGSLGGFVLAQSVAPLTSAINEIKSDLRREVERRDRVQSRLSRLEGEIGHIDRRVDDIDKIGPREWRGNP
jgi:predicted RNase H-like nuclease (RuvC/YqgF family)